MTRDVSCLRGHVDSIMKAAGAPGCTLVYLPPGSAEMIAVHAGDPLATGALVLMLAQDLHLGLMCSIGPTVPAQASCYAEHAASAVADLIREQGVQKLLNPAASARRLQRAGAVIADRQQRSAEPLDDSAMVEVAACDA